MVGAYTHPQRWLSDGYRRRLEHLGIAEHRAAGEGGRVLEGAGAGVDCGVLVSSCRAAPPVGQPTRVITVEPVAAGQRFIATAGHSLWMGDVAAILRGRLGERAAKVPTKEMPVWTARALAKVNPEVRNLRALLGRNLDATSAVRAAVRRAASAPCSSPPRAETCPRGRRTRPG